MSPSNQHNDPFDLHRFVTAQGIDYETALSELRNGHKKSHWMWYIFPQFTGLGFSSTSKHFAIKSLAEAKAYISHPILGPRLLECCETLMQVDHRSALDILGSPDNMKLRSSATLFAMVSPPGSVFEQLLNKYFEGVADNPTIQLVNSQSA